MIFFFRLLEFMAHTFTLLTFSQSYMFDMIYSANRLQVQVLMSTMVILRGTFSDSILLLQARFIAEVQRAKRASEAPWVRKIGNPSSRENLVMTSAYDRASVRTDSGGEGGASRNISHGHPCGKLTNAIFAWRCFV